MIEIDSLFKTVISVSSKLVRVRDGNLKVWKSVPIKPKKDVTIIGVRTLSNGELYNWGDHWEYAHKESIKAWLVVENMRSKPFYIERG